MPEYNILLICFHPESLKEEISFLEERNFSVYCSEDSSQAVKMLNDSGSHYHGVVLGPVPTNPASYLEAAETILSASSAPVVFYCEECAEETIDKLDTVLHRGIIPRIGGMALLKSELNRVIERSFGEPQLIQDPINRLVGIMKESNSETGKSDYGYIISGLTDAVIIDRMDEGRAIANNKTCELLGLSHEEINNGGIYKSGWEFVHEDLTLFPPEEHPHVVARETGETVKNVIMGINRPGKETLWISASSLPVFRQNDVVLSGVITTFYNITELVKIKNYNLKLAAIFQYADWGIVIGSDKGMIINVNPAFAKSHGYTIRELEGKPIRFVFPRDKWEDVSFHFNKSLNLPHYRFESVHERKDGSRFPVLINITTIRDKSGTVRYRAAFVMDITERKKREQELKSSLEELQLEKEYSDALFHKSPIAIYAVDKDCKVVNFNQKAEEITGYKKEELIGNDFNMYIDDLTRGNKGSVGKEFVIRTKDGREKVIEKYSSLLYDDKGEISGDIESFIDITNWKELQEFKSDMERIIRHDLKTPLNSIIGFPKLMLTDESLSEEYREYLMIILLAGQNMLNLINASLNLYKLEQGTYQFSLEKVEVITVLRQIRRLIKDDCQRKNCTIEFELNNSPLARDFVLELKTEKSFLFMILLNLIKNAVEASPKGEKILISIYNEGTIKINIHNKGAVPQEIRDRFFDKNITFGKKHGNGLGTYSAKLMANAIKAELTFETGEEEGTTLFLTL